MASLLGVRPRAVNRWMNGGYVPNYVFEAFSNVVEMQNDYADRLLVEWKESDQANPYIIFISNDEHEAKEKGWPSRAVEIQAIALAQTLLPSVTIQIESASVSPAENHISNVE